MKKIMMYLLVTAIACVFVVPVGHAQAPPAFVQAPLATGTTPKLLRTDSTYVVAVPGVTWLLQFPAGYLLPLVIDERPGWAYYHLGQREKDVIASVSFWVDRAEKCDNDARKCRDDGWSEKKAKLPDMQDARLSQDGEMYLYEFSKMSDGSRIYHMFANFVRDGIWIDVHLAKPISNKEKDRQMFLNFLNGVSFVPISDMHMSLWEVSLPSRSRQAFEQIRARAEKGEAFAHSAMGAGYLFGSESTARDHVAARFWFRKAADQGDIIGHRFLGMMLEQGWGGPQDYAEAITWYRKAAEQGMAVAQFSLGTMYAEGRGVPQDSVRAFMWISLASLSLPDDAKKKATDTLSKLAKGMTPEQLEKAQAMTHACRAAQYQSCDQ